MVIKIEETRRATTLPITRDTAVTGLPSPEAVRDYLDRFDRDVYGVAARRLRNGAVFVYDARDALGIAD